MAASGVSAAEVRVGGGVGFGITALRPPGAFRWDFDSLHEDTTLAVIKIGARAASLRGFVSLGAGFDGLEEATGPRFELREASLGSTHRRGASDSLALRLFARQPQSLWIDHALTPPVAAWAAGGNEATGMRADGALGRGSATLLAGWRSTLFAPAAGSPPALPPWTAPAESYLVLRVRGDVPQWAGLRVGATWKRLHPATLFVGGPSPVDAAHRDVLGFDSQAQWHGMVASVEYAHTAASPVSGVSASAGSPGTTSEPVRSSGPVTRALSPEDGLRAELRCAGLPLAGWGALGFAPQYRALGGSYVDRLADTEVDAGRPRRGLEGYRLEAWFEPAFWPGWVRQVYDRHQQFRDADRRVILQQSEVVVPLTARLRARALYVQRDELLATEHLREYHDDLLAEVAAGDAGLRCRVQAGVVDLHAPTARRVAVLEAAAHLGRRLQAVARTAYAAGDAGTRRSVFVELQYWHLPQFELAVQFGPEWIGDAADPLLDADLTADGSHIDRFRLHFRGWF